MPPSLLIQEQGSITGGHRRLFSYIVSVIHIHYWRPSRAPLGELTFESSDTSSAVGSRVTLCHAELNLSICVGAISTLQLCEGNFNEGGMSHTNSASPVTHGRANTGRRAPVQHAV